MWGKHNFPVASTGHVMRLLSSLQKSKDISDAQTHVFLKNLIKESFEGW